MTDTYTKRLLGVERAPIRASATHCSQACQFLRRGVTGYRCNAFADLVVDDDRPVRLPECIAAEVSP